MSFGGSRGVGIALAIILAASAVGVLADFPARESGLADPGTAGTETGAGNGGTVGVGDGWEPRGPPTPLPDTPIDGTSDTCDDATILGFGPLGWAWVDPTHRIQQVTGVALRSRVTHSDFPATHDSHDHNLDVLVDPGQDGLLSDVGIDHDGDGTPDTLEVEWEIGTFPSETRTDPERTFPKWAWPNVGDRVWVNGNWIFDCGHATGVGGEAHYHTEIHPPRAIASMRDQVRPLIGTGTTPVRVTTADLYIHGRAGFAGDVLACGPLVIVGFGSCAASPEPHRGTPIDDDFSFDIPLPPKPAGSVAPSWKIETVSGTGNTIPAAPAIAFVPSPADPTALRVWVNLSGTGATPDDVYAREISAGWINPEPDLRHLTLTLDQMILHEDMDLDPGDCECTFFWMGVDRAPRNEWIRMSTYATGDMGDYDDDHGAGDGRMGFSGATFDYFVAQGIPVSVHAFGYDQDCLDGLFGHHDFLNWVDNYAGCFLISNGDNDLYSPDFLATFGPPTYGIGSHRIAAGENYELLFHITDLPVGDVDAADLSVRQACVPEAANSLQEITCSVFVDNWGPGLPRNVRIQDTVVSSVNPGAYSVTEPSFAYVDPAVAGPFPCTATAFQTQFLCAPNTVPVHGRVVMTVRIRSMEPGEFANEVRVTSDSTDPDTSNNEVITRSTVSNLAVSDLSVSVTDNTDPVLAGTTLTYTITAGNAGPSAATNVVITNRVPAGLGIDLVLATAPGSCNAGTPGNPSDPTRCGFGTLAVGDSASMTIVAHVLPGTRGIVIDDATVASDAMDLDTSNNLDEERTQVDGQADLSVTVSDVPDPATAGLPMGLRVSVANAGPSTARDVRILIQLPSGVRFGESTVSDPTASCEAFDAPVNQVACRLAALLPGTDSAVLILVRVFVQPDVPAGSALTTAVVAESATADPFLGDNSATQSTTITALADVALQLSADCDVCRRSATVTYTITATNAGPSDAQDVIVVVSVPSAMTYVFDTAGCSIGPAAGTLTCHLGKVAAGGTVAFRVFLVTNTLGRMTVRADATSATTDSDSANNTASKEILITP